MTRGKKFGKKDGKELGIIFYTITVMNVNYFNFVNDFVVKNPKKKCKMVTEYLITVSKQTRMFLFLRLIPHQFILERSVIT